MKSELHVGQRRVKHPNPKFRLDLLSLFMARRYGRSRAEPSAGQMFVYEVQMCAVAYTAFLSDTRKVNWLLGILFCKCLVMPKRQVCIVIVKVCTVQKIVVSFRSEQRNTISQPMRCVNFGADRLSVCHTVTFTLH